MRFKKLTPKIGSEIFDIDLKNLSNDDIKQIRQAIIDRYVLFFRNQNLIPEDLPSIIQNFGESYTHTQETKYNKNPLIGYAKADGSTPKYNNGTGMHIDRTYHPVPPRLGMLLINECPEVGGDTIFSNAVQIYDELDEELKNELENKIAIHAPHFSSLMNTSHPVFNTRPETNQKFLYVNTGFTRSIEGVSDTILQMLLHKVEEPQYQCRFKWTPGSVALWDNWGCQHRLVYDFYPETRITYRVLTKNLY